MKKFAAILLILLCLTGMMTACAQISNATATKDETSADKTEIIIFAAASMTETLEQLAVSYRSSHPDIKLTYNFDSSGTLKTQIEEGADCDLFISAAQKQMNGLQDGGYINTDTRLDLLENKVALCVAANSKSGIKSYKDMRDHIEKGDILMAIGNEDVPVGQYTQKILAYYDLDETKLAKSGLLTYGSNVKEVTSQIAEGTVDCGIIYQTDAFSANLAVSDTATEEMCGQVIYPAAVLAASQHTAQAKAVLEYLQTAQASEVFEAVGFTPLSVK